MCVSSLEDFFGVVPFKNIGGGARILLGHPHPYLHKIHYWRPLFQSPFPSAPTKQTFIWLNFLLSTEYYFPFFLTPCNNFVIFSLTIPSFSSLFLIYFYFGFINIFFLFILSHCTFLVSSSSCWCFLSNSSFSTLESFSSWRFSICSLVFWLVKNWVTSTVAAFSVIWLDTKKLILQKKKDHSALYAGMRIYFCQNFKRRA